MKVDANFDEELMKGIARAGAGEYFFIDSADSIPKLVSKAIHGLMNVIALDGKLKVRGAGGVVVRRILGFENANLIEPLLIGDILWENKKKVLIELEVNFSSGVTQPSFTCEFSFKKSEGTGEEVILRKSIVFTPTCSEKDLGNSHPEVLVALKIKESSVKDAQISQLISCGNLAEAETVKLKVLQDLRDVEHLDPSKSITKLITKGEKALEDLKQQKNLAVASKKFHNLAYMAEQDDECGYNSGNDSDEERSPVAFNSLPNDTSSNFNDLNDDDEFYGSEEED